VRDFLVSDDDAIVGRFKGHYETPDLMILSRILQLAFLLVAANGACEQKKNKECRCTNGS
jgi:hypothetical protein